jgi:hypothetical protein
MWNIVTHALDNPLVVSTLAAAAGWAGRHLLGKKRWDALMGRAKDIMEAPGLTDDPKEALKEAWAETYNKEVEKQAAKLRLLTNGVGRR